MKRYVRTSKDVVLDDIRNTVKKFIQNKILSNVPGIYIRDIQAWKGGRVIFVNGTFNLEGLINYQWGWCGDFCVVLSLDGKSFLQYGFEIAQTLEEGSPNLSNHESHLHLESKASKVDSIEDLPWRFDEIISALNHIRELTVDQGAI